MRVLLAEAAALEPETRRRGALTVTLGTDDHTGMTSLSGMDLYHDLPRHLAEVRGRGAAF